jgi:lipoate-protein ligase A
VKAEEKISGGKLVCVEVWADGDRLVSRVRISGDFFLHPEDAIDALESSLVGLPLGSDPKRIEDAIRDSLGKQGAVFIGVAPSDLARLFIKAVSQ